MSARARFAVLAAGFALLLAATPSPPPLPRDMSTGAQGLSVAPIRLELNVNAPSGVLTVVNTNSETARFQVTGYAWNETVDGVTQLQPTDDLVFYPTLFTVAPNGEQVIRVGVEGAQSGERSFRILVEQLPAPQTHGANSASLDVRTRLSIPVFVDPAGSSPLLVVTDAEIHAQQLTLTVRNRGTQYDVVLGILATGVDASGHRLFASRGAGWYVLAGHERHFTMSVPRDACSHLTALRVSLTTEYGGPNATVPVSGCGS